MGGFSYYMKKCRKLWCIENDHNGNCTNKYCCANPYYDCGAELSTNDAMGAVSAGKYVHHNGAITCEYKNVLK